MARLLRLGCGLLLLLALASACDSQQTGDPDLQPTAPSNVAGTGTASPSATTPQPTSARPNEGMLQIGETADVSGLKITLNGVRHEDTGPQKPADGNEYLILKLTFNNTTAITQEVLSILEFQASDDQGQTYDITFGADIVQIETITGGEIAPSTSLTGEAAFEIPRTSTGLVFTYTSYTTHQAVKFKLDR